MRVKDFPREPIFPVVRAIVEDPINGFFTKFKRFLTYRRRWEVMEDYIVWSEYLRLYIIIPAGFIFDGASVPKVFHSILGPTGLLLLGACPHDFGYRYGGLIVANPNTEKISYCNFLKREVDAMFEALCTKESNIRASALLAKKAVAWFGAGNWKALNPNNRTPMKDFPGFFDKLNSI